MYHYSRMKDAEHEVRSADGDFYRQPLWHADFDDARHYHFHHGGGRSETVQRRQMDRRRTNHVGMGLDAAGNGVTRLCSLSRRSTLTRR